MVYCLENDICIYIHLYIYIYIYIYMYTYQRLPMGGVQT